MVSFVDQLSTYSGNRRRDQRRCPNGPALIGQTEDTMRLGLALTLLLIATPTVADPPLITSVTDLRIKDATGKLVGQVISADADSYGVAFNVANEGVVVLNV
jgi:hypothetical protein